MQSVIERFPHDALVSFEDASELNETTLSSSLSASKACNSPSTNEPPKSRRRLTEIIEDVGETVSPLPGDSTQDTKRPVHTNEPDRARRPSVATSAASDIKSEQPSRTLSLSERPRRYDSLTSADPSKSGTSIEPSNGLLKTSRASTSPDAGASTLTSDESLAHLYKPKIKLAPRPSLENRHSASFERPVATLPASIRLAQRSLDTMPRPQTHQVASRPFFAVPNVTMHGPSAASAYNAPTFNRPTSRAGSAATVPANARYAEHSSKATPEKQRLMKALQKRKKLQLAKSSNKEAAKQAHQETQSSEYGKNIATPMDERRTSPQNMLEKPDAFIDRGVNISANAPAPQNNVKDHSEKLMEEGISKPGGSIPQHGSHSTTSPIKTVAGMEAEANNAVTQTLRTNDEAPAPQESIDRGPKTDSSDLPKSPQVSSSAASTTTPLDLITGELQRKDGRPDEELPHLNGLNKENALASSSKPSGHDPSVESITESAPLQELIPIQEHNALRSNTEQQDATPQVTSPIKQPAETTLDRKQKPPPLTPMKTEDISRAPSLSEDSLLEELQSATVEEAKSVSLSKTPTTPFSPASPRRIEMRRSSEASRKPVQVEAEVPSTPALNPALAGPIKRLHSDSEVLKAQIEQSPPRASSSPIKLGIDTNSLEVITALPSRVDSISPPVPSTDADRPVSKKSGMSSLISQRIKALENFSSSNSQPNPPKAVVTNQIVSLRKSSLNTPPTSAGADAGRGGNYFSSQTGYPTPSPSPHGFSARLFKSAKSGSGKPKEKEASAPVNTALAKNVSNGSMDDTSTASDGPRSPSTTLSKRSSFFHPKSAKTKSTSVSSITSSKDSAVLPRAETSSSRISVSSRKSSSEAPRPIQSQSSESITSDNEKKESKGKRLFKRLSNIGSTPRRNIAQALSPTLNSQTIPEAQEPEGMRGWSSTVTVGAVNVQFPDTLVSTRSD